MVKYQLSCIIRVATFLFLVYECQIFTETFYHLFFKGTVMSEIFRIARSSSSVIRFNEKDNNKKQNKTNKTTTTKKKL